MNEFKITITRGMLAFVVTLLAGGIGGFLLRRDIQTIYQERVRTDIASLRQAVDGLRSDRDLDHAYQQSLFSWAIRISAKNGWPEPLPPQRFPPLRREDDAPESLFFDNAYAEPALPRKETP